MAQVVWSFAAQAEFASITELIAFENPAAASRFAEKVLQAVAQLARFPHSGPLIPELRGTHFRHLVVPPCRIFYEPQEERVRIIYIMRQERLFRREYVGL